jgi:hypothetical protein
MDRLRDLAMLFRWCLSFVWKLLPLRVRMLRRFGQLDLIVQRQVSSDACPLASVFCLEAPLSPSVNAPSICQTDSMRMLS